MALLSRRLAWLAFLEAVIGHGYRPARWFGATGLVVLCFALLYLPASTIPGLHAEGRFILSGEYRGRFVDALYYSATCFSTLGFGDITPVNAAARLAAVCEAMIGYLMLGLLVSVAYRSFYSD